MWWNNSVVQKCRQRLQNTTTKSDHNLDDIKLLKKNKNQSITNQESILNKKSFKILKFNIIKDFKVGLQGLEP
jgi:hypothetical protein